MPIFNVRHAECDNTGEGEFVEAKDAKAAVDQVNPHFSYSYEEGVRETPESDSWTDVKSHLKRIRPVSGSRPTDILKGTEPNHATVDSSFDYYLVYQVSAVPAGKVLMIPSQE